MKKVHNVDVLGVVGQGATKALARADAEAEIRRIVQADSHVPMLVELRGFVALVYAQRGWWGYRVIVKPGEPVKVGDVYFTCHASWDRVEAMAYARSHLAQYAWSFDEPDDEAFIGEVFPLARRDVDTLGRRMADDLRGLFSHYRKVKDLDEQARNVGGPRP